MRGLGRSLCIINKLFNTSPSEPWLPRLHIVFLPYGAGASGRAGPCRPHLACSLCGRQSLVQGGATVLDDDLGPVCVFGSEVERVVMAPERTAMAAYRSAEVVRLSMPRPAVGRQLQPPRPGKGRTPRPAQCLEEPGQQGTRWKRPQSRYDFYFLCRSFF